MPINTLPTPNDPRYRAAAPSPAMPGSWTASSSIINRAVPNGGGLTEMASNRIRSLLGGMPGTSVARRANAYFGGASGMPGSEFVRNRGFDLYNQQGEQRQQQGFQDLLSLIASTTAPTLQQQGQDIQQNQFGQNLGEQQRQFDFDYWLKRQQTKKLYGPNNPNLAGTRRYGGVLSPSPLPGFDYLGETPWRS